MISVLTDDAAVVATAPQWRALWARCPRRSPFASPDWLLAWWRRFGTGRPVVALLREGERLCALLPCYVLADGRTKLLPIGVSLSDHFDALIAPDAPADAAGRLLAAVLEAVPDVETCDLLDLPPGAALLSADDPVGWRTVLHPGEPCPVLPIREGASFAETIPAKARRKLRMNRHRADRAGGWAIRRVEADRLDGAFADLTRLHQARWTAQGEAGVLGDPRVGPFLAEALPRLLAAEVLDFATFHIDGAVAAALLAFRAAPDRLLVYLGGFDERFAFFSPGSILLGECAEATIATGVREIDFLRGAEAYKYAWGATDRFNTTRQLVRL